MLRALLFMIVLVFCTQTSAAGPPAPGNPIKKANAGPGTTFGPEWFLQPSDGGQLDTRNTIVLHADVGGTGACSEEIYIARTYFKNTAGLTVNNANSSVVPDEIFIFGIVCTDRNDPNSITYQVEYRWALPADTDSVNPRGAWDMAQGVEINEDFAFNGTGQLTDRQNAYDYILTYTPNSLRNSLIAHEIESYRNGNKTLTLNNFTSVMSDFPRPVEIGAPLNQTFDEVAVSTHGGYGRDGGWVRLHAKGVGQVQLVRNAGVDDPVYDNQNRFDAIYYRIDGVSKGDLAGTPFDGGGSAGLWFVH